MKEDVRYCYASTPVGQLLLVADDGGLRRLEFEKNGKPKVPEAEWTKDETYFAEPLRQLEAYFDGSLREFDMPLAPEGTPFQREVWQALCEIPYGTTISYGELANRIDRPNAFRAVGAANGRNPISIVIPCHRVIGANGTLTGFGGGLPTKRHLLTHEQSGGGGQVFTFD
jgi:methylated-DNA-[protein]-cysteine S-methyltransferase